MYIYIYVAIECTAVVVFRLFRLLFPIEGHIAFWGGDDRSSDGLVCRVACYQRLWAIFCYFPSVKSRWLMSLPVCDICHTLLLQFVTTVVICQLLYVTIVVVLLQLLLDICHMLLLQFDTTVII